jgi:ribonuclease P protein component
MTRPAERLTQETHRPEDRVRSRAQYREAQEHGRRVHTPHYLVVVLPRPSARTRLGITVTKKVSPSAVSRNRVKRVLREVFRKNRGLFPSGCDVVIIAKRGADALGYAEAASEIEDVSSALFRTMRKS